MTIEEVEQIIIKQNSSDIDIFMQVFEVDYISKWRKIQLKISMINFNLLVKNN
jgi:hypothetical protein